MIRGLFSYIELLTNEFFILVSCRNLVVRLEHPLYALWKCIKRENSKNQTDNTNNYVNTKDIINLQSDKNGSVLRSHNFTFDIDDEIYQEVGVHYERIGGIDEVCLNSQILYFN